MKSGTIVFLLLATLSCRSATPPAVAPATDPALAGAIARVSDAVERAPHALQLRYLLATYYDQARDSAKVEHHLGALEGLGWQHGLDPGDFPNTTSAGFKEIAARLDAREPIVHRATRAYTLDRDLIPEGIAWSPIDGALYVSSIYRRKIVRIGADGGVSDFIPEAASGIYAVLGMKVDVQRRLLWTASHASENMIGYVPGMKGKSTLIAFDLGSGAVVRRLEVGSSAEPTLLNDMAILADGTVVVTDSERGLVLKLVDGSDALETIASRFSYPNGIAPAGPGSVYVADFMGLHLVDLATKERTPVAAPPGQLLAGVDGLSRHGNSLIGVQNSIGRPRIIRMTLDGDGKAVTSVEVLESRNEDFIIPTTGTVAGNRYYFIANSQLRAFTDQAIWPAERLRPVAILQIDL